MIGYIGESTVQDVQYSTVKCTKGTLIVLFLIICNSMKTEFVNVT